MAFMRGPLHGTAIFVDTFQPVRGLPGGVFFLTHAHTDHMTGLHRLWRAGKLHCSRMTADFLVAKRMCVPDIIRAHDLDTRFDVEDPLHPRQGLTGIFVDASHCAGSVMLIVEGMRGGPVIFTGDFRFNGAHLHNCALARMRGLGPTLYLDVTFASRHLACRHFPTKSDAIGQVLDLIDTHASGGDTIFLHSNGLGDEELLVAVANHVRPQVLYVADRERFDMFRVFDREHGALLTDPGKCCRHE